MKVTDLKTQMLYIPLPSPVKSSMGMRENITILLVELETDQGISGYGESVGIFFSTAQTILEREIRPRLIGEDPTRIEWVHDKFNYLVEWNPFAAYPISAVDMALLDISGKEAGVPAYRLLGGQYREEVPFIGYIHLGDAKTDAEKARRLVEEGYKTLKVKIGPDPKLDLQRLRAIRDAVGYGVALRVDVNMKWTPVTAIKYIEKLERFDLEYVEQPVPSWDVEGMAQVSRAVSVPIAADESCRSVRDALRLAEARACEVFVIYISEAGGVTKAKEIVSIANAAGITCVLGTWGEAGAAFAAGLHLIASSANFPLANDTVYPEQVEDYITERHTICGGLARVPQKPGLGIEVDRQKVEQLSSLALPDSGFADPDDPRWIFKIGQLM